MGLWKALRASKFRLSTLFLSQQCRQHQPMQKCSVFSRKTPPFQHTVGAVLGAGCWQVAPQPQLLPAQLLLPPTCLTTALPCAPFAVSVTPLSFRLPQHFSVGPIPRQKRPRRGAAVLLFLLRPGCHLPLGKDGACPVRGKQISACRPSAPTRPPSCGTVQPPPVRRRQRLLKILGGRRGRAPNTFHYFPSVCLITDFFEVLVLSSVLVRERAQ